MPGAERTESAGRGRPDLPTVDENRPWLTGANEFIRKTLWPEIQVLVGSYRPPTGIGGRLGCLFAAGVPAAAAAMIWRSMTYDSVTDEGTGLFTAGLLLLLVSPFVAYFGKVFITEAVSPKPGTSVDTEKRLVGTIAGFLGFAFEPGRRTVDTGIAATEGAAERAFARSLATLHPLLKLGGDPGRMRWSDRLTTDRFGRPVTAWDLSAAGFRGIAVRIPEPRADAVGCVVGVARLGSRKTVSRIDRTMELAGHPRVVLESDDFAKAFATFAGDQVAARRLLTPAVMPRLAAAVAAVPCAGAWFVFADGHLALLFHTGNDPFDFAYEETPDCVAAVERLFGELSAVLDVADALELDRTSRL